MGLSAHLSLCICGTKQVISTRSRCCLVFKRTTTSSSTQRFHCCDVDVAITVWIVCVCVFVCSFVSFSLSLTHTHVRARTHTNTHTHAQTYKHTHTHTPSPLPPPSLSLSLSRATAAAVTPRAGVALKSPVRFTPPQSDDRLEHPRCTPAAQRCNQRHCLPHGQHTRARCCRVHHGAARMRADVVPQLDAGALHGRCRAHFGCLRRKAVGVGGGGCEEEEVEEGSGSHASGCIHGREKAFFFGGGFRSQAKRLLHLFTNDTVHARLCCVVLCCVAAVCNNGWRDITALHHVSSPPRRNWRR